LIPWQVYYLAPVRDQSGWQVKDKGGKERIPGSQIVSAGNVLERTVQALEHIQPQLALWITQKLKILIDLHLCRNPAQ